MLGRLCVCMSVVQVAATLISIRLPVFPLLDLVFELRHPSLKEAPIKIPGFGLEGKGGSALAHRRTCFAATPSLPPLCFVLAPLQACGSLIAGYMGCALLTWFWWCYKHAVAWAVGRISGAPSTRSFGEKPTSGKLAQFQLCRCSHK